MHSVWRNYGLILSSLLWLGCSAGGSGASASAADTTESAALADTATPEGQDDTPTQPDSTLSVCERVAAIHAQSLVRSCQYTNPYSQRAECRSYHGAWTEAEVQEACATVYTGTSGKLGVEACPGEGLVGTCGAQVLASRYLAVHFYDGDEAQLASVCTQFLSGDYCAEDAAAAPVEPLNPLEEALLSMISDDEVLVAPECIDDACLATLVAQREGISFTPLLEEVVAGFVFYPGAFVDPRAYAPLARRMAKMGLKVVIVPMPGNMAITGIDRAKDVITADIPHWFIGGHSMGGAMAVSFVRQFNDTVGMAGVVLWAAYPGAADDLSADSLPVLSLAGSLDGVATPQEIEAGKPRLPETAEYHMLEGANHAQFGTYGTQNGDLSPTMSALEQHQLVAGLTTHFIKRVALGVAPDATPLIADSEATAICASAQWMFLGMEESGGEETVKVTGHSDFELFAKSKPALAVDGAQVVVEVQAMSRPFANGLLPEKTALLPGEVWCKMKTQSAFEEISGLIRAPADVDCAAINQHALDLAKATLGTEVEQALTLGEDIAFETGFEWLKSGAVLLDEDTLRSPRVVVGDLQSIPEEARHVVYCKVWSPSRALYYLMTGH